jgi:dTDP-4-dehydrorhamnose 3,5-epimerase
MNRLTTTDLSMPGLKLVQRKNLADSRGFLSRVFCSDELGQAGWIEPIAQINHTFTAQRGTIRGMHFQLAPYSEMKLVSCFRGEVWDVVVDVRKGSETFLQWHAEILSAQNQRALLIPKGFAHGFQSLSDDVELLYCHSASYHAEAERGLHPEDSRLAIQWPLPMTELSARDAQHVLLDDQFKGVVL